MKHLKDIKLTSMKLGHLGIFLCIHIIVKFAFLYRKTVVYDLFLRFLALYYLLTFHKNRKILFSVLATAFVISVIKFNNIFKT